MEIVKEPDKNIGSNHILEGQKKFFHMNKITLKSIFIFGVLLFLTTSIASAQTTLRYAQDLYFGIKNSSVSILQTDLASDSSIYPEKLVTGYFGSLTQKAVQRFQVKNGIVNSGTPSTTGYGRVGPKTRAKLNELFGNQVIGDPAIRVLSPNGGEKLIKGTRTAISWEGLMARPPFIIKLWKGSELVQNIAFNYFSASPYYWDIPTNLLDGNDYTIEVWSGDFSDKSDAPFNLLS